MTDQLSETQTQTQSMAASSLREIKSSIGLLSAQIEAEILALQGQVRVLQALLKVDQDLARAGILALTDNDRELTFNYLRQIAGDEDETMRDANACLIVAAPDLLEACEALLAWYEEGMPSAYDIAWTEGFRKAKAAVAKAQGVRTAQCPLTKGPEHG